MSQILCFMSHVLEYYEKRCKCYKFPTLIITILFNRENYVISTKKKNIYVRFYQYSNAMNYSDTQGRIQ